MIKHIERQLAVLEKAAQWESNVPNSERLNFKKKIVKIRRDLKRIQYAVSEPCSTAAFGESQMGKSYLISAMLSTPDHPFSVMNANEEYDFISEVNPSRPNSKIEATGIITRFTSKTDSITPEGFLKVQMLSVADIILILCESFYNQIDYQRDEILGKDDINDVLNAVELDRAGTPAHYLTDDDILDIKEYIQGTSTLAQKCTHLIDSDIFNFLLQNVGRMDERQLEEVISLLWNREEYLCRLWNDLMEVYRLMDFNASAFVRFDAVLKRKGTLLDVARLDEMYGQPEDSGDEYEPTTEVMINGNTLISLKKSFLSALIAELKFILPSAVAKERPFLNDLDILDFPGARRPDQIKGGKLGEGKNLSTIFRRGKVSYLFNKYSVSKRINTLLFCQNNDQNSVSIMGGLLDRWVTGNIGGNPAEREEYMRVSSVSPLFIVGTYFNTDLEYHEEAQNDLESLRVRWSRRFSTVLEKEVLKSLDDKRHWFNDWAVAKKPFQNLFMLRDFKFSKNIYRGYDPAHGRRESELIAPQGYPRFYDDLRTSFVTNDFVRLHFANPAEAWDEAASCAKDGSRLILSRLNQIAPNVAKARNDKFLTDFKKAVAELSVLLQQYYHPDDSDAKLKLALRQSGAARRSVDKMIGCDPYSFGRLMDTLKITESEIYELVHAQLLGEEQQNPMSGEESQIFMSAGLDTSVSREENLERLCLYLGVDDEDECRQELEGIDIDHLLSQNQMMTGRAENLVTAVERLWHESVLMERTVHSFESVMPQISTLMSTMWVMYKLLDVRKMLIQKVGTYIDTIDKEASIGIISDYLSMQLNEFSSTFGYKFISGDERTRILAKNKQLSLGIDETILEAGNGQKGIGMLADLSKMREILSGGSFTVHDRAFLNEFPQFMRVLKWEQQLRVAFILSGDLPDYDLKANTQLRAIIQEMKNETL